MEPLQALDAALRPAPGSGPAGPVPGPAGTRNHRGAHAPHLPSPVSRFASAVLYIRIERRGGDGSKSQIS